MSDLLFHMVAGGPAPVAPYSHAVEAGGWVFVTGQLATDLEDASRPLPDGIEAQTHKAMDNLRRVLEGVGLGFDRVVFARVYLTDFERDYAAMNEVYKSYFKPGALPGRTTVGVTGLARGGLVEIDLIARRG